MLLRGQSTPATRLIRCTFRSSDGRHFFQDVVVAEDRPRFLLIFTASWRSVCLPERSGPCLPSPELPLYIPYYRALIMIEYQSLFYVRVVHAVHSLVIPAGRSSPSGHQNEGGRAQSIRVGVFTSTKPSTQGHNEGE